MKSSKKIEFSNGVFFMFRMMEEDLQDSIFAAMARVGSKLFNTLKMKPVNSKENSYFIRIDEGYTIVFEIQEDTILVTGIVSDYAIKSYKESMANVPQYEKI